MPHQSRSHTLPTRDHFFVRPAFVSTSSTRPNALASLAWKYLSRSVSFSITSSGWPVCFDEDLVEPLALLQDLVGLDLDVRDLPADLAVRLVDHHLRVRQAVALALGAGGEQDRRAAGGQAHAVGVDRRFEELHRVVDRQRRRDAAAGAVDVHVDVGGLVLVLEEQEPLDDDAGEEVGDDRAAAGVGTGADEDDAVLEQQVAEGHHPLAGVLAALEQRLKRAGGGHRFEGREHAIPFRASRF